MNAVLRNIWVRMCCRCLLPANKTQTANTGGSIQRLLKTNIITLHNYLQVQVKFRVRKKVFIYFIFYIYLKRMGLNLSTNLPMFVYAFQAMWRHRPLKEYSVFVGIRVASTFFSLYTLYITTCIPTRIVRTCFCAENLEAASNIPIWVNFKVFSFVMAYNN